METRNGSIATKSSFSEVTALRNRFRLARPDLERVIGGRLTTDAAAFIWQRSRPGSDAPSRPVAPWR